MNGTSQMANIILLCRTTIDDEESQSTTLGKLQDNNLDKLSQIIYIPAEVIELVRERTAVSTVRYRVSLIQLVKVKRC